MKVPSNTPPIFNGLIFSQSAYNKAIPVLYGRSKVSPVCIFAGNWANATKGGGLSGSGVASSGSGSSGAITYYANFDLILGYGPFQGNISSWAAGSHYYVNYFSQTITQAGPATSFTFTVTNMPAGSPMKHILGVCVLLPYSVTYNDYGGIGSQSYSGTSLLPLYNQLYPAPNNGDWQYANGPYATYNVAGTPYPSPPNVTVVFPTSQSSCTIQIAYAYRAGSSDAPTPMQGTAFVQELGTGSAYSFSGAPTAIHYPEFSGFDGQRAQLSGPNTIGQYQFESLGLYCHGYLPPGFLGQSGLCNPADLIIDIICSGGYKNTATAVWNHGLNFTSFPDNNTYNFSRYGGILGDEPNLWGPTFGGGSNLGLNGVRNYCMANGIVVAGVMDSQQNAASWLQDLCDIANCAPAWDGAQLDFIPYSEVSFFGNGTSYVAPTAGGPLFTFTSDDFIVKKGDPPVTITRARGDSNYNQLIVEYLDQKVAIGAMAPQWNTNSVTVVDELDMIQNGAMPGETKSLHWIAESSTATLVANALLKRHMIIQRVSYKFKLNASWGPILTPMCLVLVDDAALSPFPVPVRITSIDENEDWSLDIEAELFAYGASAPQLSTTQESTQQTPPSNADPGAVSTPIIFETIPALISTGPMIAIAVGGNATYYGGCIIWLSTDGGNNYGSIGSVTGSQTMGVTYSNDYPIGTDPDSTNTLNVDLTPSAQTLPGFTAGQRDIWASLSYLSPGGTTTVGGQTLTIPYELIAYESTILSSLSKYSCPPTIRRGVYGTPIADHPIGSDFSFLQDGNLFTFALNPSWIGTTLFFKFTAFNTSGQNQQLLSVATAYTFTPTGEVGWTISGGGGSPVPPPTIPIAGAEASDYYIYVPPAAGTYSASQELYFSKPPRTTTIPSGMAGTNGGCRIAPTGNISVTLLKNGSSIGTVNIAAAATTATYTFTTAQTFSGGTSGDTFSITAPVTTDPTFQGFWLNIYASRSN